MIWSAKFNGRNVGASGITYPISTYAYGVDETMARMNLYERFEHIMFLKLELRPIKILKECQFGDHVYLVENNKLKTINEVTKNLESAWEIMGGDVFAGFINCRNSANGIISQLNDGTQCIVRPIGPE